MTNDYPHPFYHFNSVGRLTCNFISDAAMKEAKQIIDKEGGWIEDAAAQILYGKKPIGTIDITPTWRAILPILLAAYKDGTETGQRLAFEELQRMAMAADAYNLNSKPAPLDADENIGSVKP